MIAFRCVYYYVYFLYARLFRQLSHGAFKKISKFFYKWVRAIDTGKKKSLLRGVEEQLDYMLLKSQIELLRNGENLSAKLIAEKALNRLVINLRGTMHVVMLI